VFRSKSTSISKRFVSATCSIFIGLGLLSGCASTQDPKASQTRLAELCAKQDLTDVSQRTVLAGGYFALERNDLPCAERLTLDAREKNPKDAYATLNLGAIYQRTNRESMAKEMYAKTMELDGGKSDNDKAPESHLATRDPQKNKRPNDIAKHNLALLAK
jgi:Tfp pilus assembly protein PilF